MLELYLSKTSIAVSGKLRLASRLKIFTLTGPGLDSGDSVTDGRTCYEGEEGEEDRKEEDGEEEEEVTSTQKGCTLLRLISLMRFARVVGMIVLLSGSTAAHAVSITNRDDQDHTVTIVEGETKTEHVLKPSQALSGICAKGCTVHLDGDTEEEYQLEAEDVVSIEEGSLYYDTPADAPAAPAPATGDGKPANKG